MKCISPQLIKEAIFNSHVVRIKLSSLTVFSGGSWHTAHDSSVFIFSGNQNVDCLWSYQTLGHDKKGVPEIANIGHTLTQNISNDNNKKKPDWIPPSQSSPPPLVGRKVWYLLAICCKKVAPWSYLTRTNTIHTPLVHWSKHEHQPPLWSELITSHLSLLHEVWHWASCIKYSPRWCLF